LKYESLNLKNYLEYLDFGETGNSIYLPVNLVPCSLETRSKTPISLSQERHLRKYGCVLIEKAALMLKLSRTSIATAQAILQRFYFRKSFQDQAIDSIATASLYLAAKVEEEPRKFKDIVSVFDYCTKRICKPSEHEKIDLLDLSSYNFIDRKE
jgi:transcription initiation factor TFIIIB Brf1 subunit/transcription initiation factor TFIIB